jgi:SAM-dependent methyltransferase
MEMIDLIGARMPLEGAQVLDVGSGWLPIIPIMFSFRGVGKIYLTDLNRLMSLPSLNAAIRALRAEEKRIAAHWNLPPGALSAFLAQASSATNLDQALGSLRLSYLAPCDCQHLDLPANSLDLVISRAVLEHVPPPVIQNIFIEAQRLLKPGALTAHIVDNSDHWEHGDKSLSRINFLRFSADFFRWTHINSLDYQNRLRHSQYIAMLRKANLTMVEDRADVDPQALADTKTLPLHPDFQGFAPEDLAAINSWLLARKT